MAIWDREVGSRARLEELCFALVTANALEGEVTYSKLAFRLKQASQRLLKKRRVKAYCRLRKGCFKMQITSAFVAQNVLPDYWRPIVSSNVTAVGKRIG